MIARLLGAACSAALLTGALEALWITLQTEATGARLLASAGAVAALTPLWAAAIAATWAVLRSGPIQRWWQRLAGPEWPDALGTMVAIGGGGLVLLGAARLGLRVVGGGLEDPTLLPPLSVVVILMSGALAVVAALGTRDMLASGLRRLPRGVAIGGACLALIISLLILIRPAWRILFVARSAAPLVLALIAVSGGVWWMRRAWRWRGVIPLVIVTATLAVFGLRTLIRVYPILGPVAVSDALAQRVVEGLQAVSDRDGDGASSLIYMHDCDDTDPTVHPGAPDIPENGIDENCDGEDAALAVVERVPVEHHPLPKAFKRHRWNVLLVTIDTLRPDRLGAYGHDRPTSPNIDRLAKDGFRFKYVWAPASKTSDSIPALMSGRFVSEMDLDRRTKPGLVLPSNDLIAERFARGGWFTHAAMIKRFGESFWFGMDQGMERVDLSPIDFTRTSAPDIAQRVIKAWDDWDQAEDPRPFFAWVHFHEPHARYVKHEGFDFGDDDIDRYDSEIAFVDAQIGRLVQALNDRNLADRTIVVITSDHGEAFREHGQPYHGRALWEEAIRIPLIIRIPGVRGRAIGGPVSLVDLPETLANLAGLPPGDGPSARSLVGAMAAKGKANVPRHDIWLDSLLHQDKPHERLLGVVRWPYKAVMDFRNGRMTLFDLAKDPGETDDLVQRDPKRAEWFGRHLRARMASYNQGEVARAIADRRFSEPPEGVPARGVEIAEGVEWLGGRFEQSEMKRFRVLRNWFRATGARRPDYHFRVVMKDSTGKWSLTRDLRPVVGRYPTHRWRTGEIVEDIRWVKKRGRPPYTVKLGVKRGRKQIGPLRDVVADPAGQSTP